MTYMAEMTAIADFVAAHHDALVADFQRDYGLDLDQIIEDGISANRMRALVNGVSVEGALYRDLNPDVWFWTSDLELLATLCELVDLLNRNFVASNSDGSSPQPEPINIPRPGREKPLPAKGTSIEELKALLPKGALK